MRSRAFSGVLVVGSAMAVLSCGALIGTNDVYFQDEGGAGPTGTPDAGGGDGAQATPESGTDADSGGCGDTVSSGDNCGACGHSCLGGKCSMSTCEPVQLAGSIAPYDIAIDANHIYWTEPGAPRVSQSNLDGTGFLLLGGTGDNYVQGLGIDDTNIYWGTLDGIVKRCKIGGCSGTGTAVSAATDNVGGLVVDSTSVYWVDSPDTNPESSKIMKVAKGANGATATAISTISGVALDRLATDGTYIYMTGDDGTIRRVPVAGGTPTIIAKGLADAGNLVVDDVNVYWSVEDTSAGTIDIAAKDGSSPDKGHVLVASQALPLGIAVDANNIYWVDAGGLGGTTGSVMTCVIASCTPKALATNQNAPTEIAVDSKAIYWTNYATGQSSMGALMRLAK